MILYDVINKTEGLEVSQSALISLVSIILVFAVLLIIIGITELVFKLNGLLDLKKDAPKKVKKNSNEVITKSTDIKDDDMMAAVLVATIDYREETKKDVKLVSVCEVKNENL